MIAPITAHTIKRHYKAALFTGIGLLLIALMFAGLFEELKGEIGRFTDILPAGMEAIIGDLATAKTPEGWLGIELYALFFPLAIAIVAVVFGQKVVGQEESDGTIELIASRPISRYTIMSQKALALALLLAFVAILLWIGTAVGSWLFPFDVDPAHTAQASLAGWLLGLGFGTITLAAHSLSGRQGLSAAIGAGWLGLAWVMFIVSQLVDSMEHLKHFSPFYYYKNPDVLLHGVEWPFIMTLTVIAIVGFIVALIGFTKRDFRTS